MANKQGVITIHNKQYKTVALRVNEFREERPEWAIETEIIENTDQRVIMKATIGKPVEGSTAYLIIGTGYAEEMRGSSQINRTSALENCETSAIGRALAACGYGGEEYASANEVQNAIGQQKEQMTPEPINHEKVQNAVSFFKKQIDLDCPEETADKIKSARSRLTNDEWAAVRDQLNEKAPDSNRLYRTLLDDHMTFKPEVTK